MKLMAFCVRDEKAEAYLRPFFSDTRGSALRAFGDAVNDPQSPFFKHPADYTLFEIGSFNELSGQMTPATAIVSLGNAVEFIESRGADLRVAK